MFGSQAYLLTPLTFDRDTVLKQLNDSVVGLPGRQTAIGDAVGLAVKRLQNRPRDQRVVILLTDGVNDAGELDPHKSIDLAVAEHVKIYTIGIGAESMRVDDFFGSHTVNPSADLDERLLTEMAEKTGGRFFRARDTDELAKIYREIDALEPAAERRSSSVPSMNCSTGRCRRRCCSASRCWRGGCGARRLCRGECGAMSVFFSNFHFLRPWWLLALVALPLIWRALRARPRRRAAPGAASSTHICSPHLLVRDDGATDRSRSPRVLALPAFVLACLALAGPAWEQLPQPLYQNKAARVIALELSATMLAQDVKPSRFERARFKIADILKRSADGQTALIAYAGDAFVVAPLTDDANTVSNLVDALEPTVMPVRGNDTGRRSTCGVADPQRRSARRRDRAARRCGRRWRRSAVRRARAQGVRVSVLGIGSAQGAPVPLQQADS